MKRIETNNLIAFSKEGPAKSIFYDEGNLKAQFMCLKEGQIIPPCKMGNDVLFYVIQGEGEIIVDNEKEALFAGVSVIVPKKAESRSISAKTDLIILAVQAKGK